MRRTSLMLAAAGGVAVLAVTGAALGATAADRSTGRTAPAAVTVEDNPARTATSGEDNPARSGTNGEDNPARTATGDDDDPARRGADDDAGPTRAAGGTVSRQRAAEVALTRIGGGRVTEIEAETEHGRPAWSVKVSRDGWRHEVKVDRVTGTVLAADRQRAGTDDRDGRDDGARDDRNGRDDDGARDDHRRGDDDGGRDDHGRSDDRGTHDRDDDHGRHGDDD
ncbi:PepSY domain-containing protein [Micromonospora sp. NPDC018662]|uniref:PepSY domain-containing protein n=1 Tax=Micromonospora sp. NPDC018662 TaxID=3364238 RepID=UPI0037ADD9D1